MVYGIWLRFSGSGFALQGSDQIKSRETTPQKDEELNLLACSPKAITYICIQLHTITYIHTLHIYITYIHTSSTAQGGGGSFKNRKPIGEIGGCESHIPEQKY